MKRGERFINFRPTAVVALGVIFGVLSAYVYIFYSKTAFFIAWAVFFALLITVLLLFYARRISLKKTLTIVFAFILCGVGAVRTLTDFNGFDSADIPETTYSVSGKVESLNGSDGVSEILLSDLVFESYDGIHSDYKMSVKVFDDCFGTSVRLGDYISFSAKVYNYGTVYDAKPSVTHLMDRVKFYGEADSFDKIVVVKNDASVFGTIANFLDDALKSGFGESEEYGVAKGLILGGGGSVSNDTLASFRYTGIAHIFAVSGLHIGFTAAILSFLVKIFKIKKPIGSVVTVLCLFFYSGVCGFTVSSLRAAIMFSVLCVAKESYLKYDSLSSISFAAALLLIIFPFELFGAGFLLSFGTSLSIILFGDRLKEFFENGLSKIFKRLPERFVVKISSVFALPIASMLGAAPIGLYFFGYFSSLSVLVNLIFVPIISVVFPFVLIGAVLGGIFGISGITLFLPSVFLKIIRFCLWGVNTYPLAVSISFYLIPTVFYYVALLIASGTFNISDKLKRIVSIGLIAVSLTSAVVYSTVYDNAVKVKAYYDGYTSAALVCRNDTDIVIINSKYVSDFAVKRISLEVTDGKIEKMIFTDIDSDIIKIIEKFRNKTTVCAVNYYEGEYVSDYFGISIRRQEEKEEFSSAIVGNYVGYGYGYEIFAAGKSFAFFAELPSGNVAPLLPTTPYDYVLFVNRADFFTKQYKNAAEYSFWVTKLRGDGYGVKTEVFI